MFFMNWLQSLTGSLLFLGAIFLIWLRYSQQFWKRNGVPTQSSKFFLGHTREFWNKSLSEIILDHYFYYRNLEHKHGGLYFFWKPVYMPLDLGIIKNFLLSDSKYFIGENDQYNFHGRGFKLNTNKMKLSPLFCTKNMELMFSTLLKCGSELNVEMEKNLGRGLVNIKDIVARFSTDTLASCIFGFDNNSLKRPATLIYRMNRLFSQTSSWQTNFMNFMAPKLATFYLNPEIERHNSVVEFFLNLIHDSLKHHKGNRGRHDDFLHFLLNYYNSFKAERNCSEEDKLEVEKELVFQAFVMFSAGFATASSLLTFALVELAGNQEIQERVRLEIRTVLDRNEGKLSYHTINEMTYLDKVINETLRKYPPFPVLTRVCIENYKIPGTGLKLKRGTRILIPIIGLHRDKAYFPDPDKFDPERDFLHFDHAFLPFGSCIGSKFGLVVVKVGLVALLRNYNFSLSTKSILPLKLDPKSVIMAASEEIWLKYVQC